MNWITTYESWSMGGYNEINKTTYDDMTKKRSKVLMTSTEIDHLEKMMHENKFREMEFFMYLEPNKWQYYDMINFEKTKPKSLKDTQICNRIVSNRFDDRFFLLITITKLDDDYFLVHQKKGIPGDYVHYFFLCDEFTGLDSCLKKIIIKDDENEEI